MRSLGGITVTILLCVVVPCIARAQDETRPGIASNSVSSKTAQADASNASTRKHGSTLSTDERLAVIASALDSKTPRFAERDCSHLVHAIYERAGFPYAYASSDDLYDGVEGFQKVSQPQPGDLVVWHGHAGIVIRPTHHVFFSFLHAGPGIDDYESRYWTGRGQPRFFRYLKGVRCLRCGARGKAQRLK
jgi:cell wall-associated NlpC family hydrolase